MFRRKGGGFIGAALALLVLLAGCAHQRATPEAATPAAVTLASSRSVYAVPARRVSNLLNFETRLDMQFVVADPPSSVTDVTPEPELEPPLT